MSDEPGFREKLLRPQVIRREWEKQGLDKEEPAMWDMICWIDDVNSRAGIHAINFNDFLEQVMFFFSQRHTEKGAQSIFNIVNTTKSQEITFEQF